MSVGSAIQSALLSCIGSKPQEVFSSSAQECVLMADLVQEAAADIAKSHDWRGLTEIVAIPGGSTSFTLPSDYDRMALGMDFKGLEAVGQVADWVDFTGPGWIIIGGQIQFKPMLTDAVSMVYLSNLWARRNDGTRADSFQHDDDAFVLDERLLKLSLIWRYKEASGLEYAEDQENYSLALGQEQGRDPGAYMLHSPTACRHLGGNPSYSGRAFP